MVCQAVLARVGVPPARMVHTAPRWGVNAWCPKRDVRTPNAPKAPIVSKNLAGGPLPVLAEERYLAHPSVVWCVWRFWEVRVRCVKLSFSKLSYLKVCANHWYTQSHTSPSDSPWPEPCREERCVVAGAPRGRWRVAWRFRTPYSSTLPSAERSATGTVLRLLPPGCQTQP